MMYYVYVLRGLKDRKFYIGYSRDLKRRIRQHQQGQVRSTNERGEMKLIFFEAFVSAIDARRRERYLKSSKGRSALRMMLRDTLY